MASKVMCIGLSKTGTTSLGKCLEVLGYRHLAGFQPDVAALYEAGDFAALDRLVDDYDSYDDWPWPAVFQRYARAHPTMKFVLTLRASPEVWLESFKNHCEQYLFRWADLGRFNRLFFGASSPYGHEAEHVEAYLRHAELVRAEFEHEPERLLELCFATDPVWERLSAFLDVPVPSVDVPHVNVRGPGVSWRRSVKRMWLRSQGWVERHRQITCTLRYTDGHDDVTTIRTGVDSA